MLSCESSPACQTVTASDAHLCHERLRPAAHHEQAAGQRKHQPPWDSLLRAISHSRPAAGVLLLCH